MFWNGKEHAPCFRNDYSLLMSALVCLGLGWKLTSNQSAIAKWKKDPAIGPLPIGISPTQMCGCYSAAWTVIPRSTPLPRTDE
jgi:hypothetical protein